MTPTSSGRIDRPRVSERALPRLTFGEGRCRVLVHDIETGDAFAIDPRAWVLLASADGTRDREGILLAASREGVIATRDELDALLDDLDRRGMIESGPPPRRVQLPPRDPSHVAAAAQRTVETLPGYRFRCDGLGTCCKLYSTIVFSPIEAARARVVRPDILDGGERQEHVFMPERGVGRCSGSAVALVDGACAYLEGTLCGLHRKAGAQSKPVGCNVFPLSLVDDGRRVRASVLVECACVLESASHDGGEPLVPASVRTRADLDPSLVVEELPPTIDLSPNRSSPIEPYLDFCDAALDALPHASDPAAFAFSLASAVDAHGLDPQNAHRALESSAVDRDGDKPASRLVDKDGDKPASRLVDIDLAALHISALGSLAARRALLQRALFSEREVRRRGVDVLAASAALLADRDLLAAVIAGAGACPRDEALYLKATLFGHQLARSPLIAALRDRAVVIWIARVFPLAAEALHGSGRDVAFEHPIALVEALFRGHGLRRYLEDSTLRGRAASTAPEP